MSIDRDAFEEASEEELREYSVTDRVLGYLAVNDEQAFKAVEIARRIDADEGPVSSALTRLKRRDLVEHKGTYWAITSNEDRLRQSDGYARATALFNEQFGAEDRNDWDDHAPDEPHPSVAGDEE